MKVAISDIQKLFLGLEFLSEFKFVGIPEKDWREASAAHQGMTLLQGMIAALEISI